MNISVSEVNWRVLSDAGEGEGRESLVVESRVVLKAMGTNKVLKTYYGTISFCYATSNNDSC